MGYPSYHRQMLADPYYQATVANLRQAREAAGLSQDAVAQVVGVQNREVSCWERLVHLPSLYHYIKWCEMLEKEKE